MTRKQRTPGQGIHAAAFFADFSSCGRVWTSNGRIDVMFDDRSYSGNALVDVTYASSSDGGATWTPVRVTSSGFDPGASGVPDASSPTGIRPFIGDYNGIASLADHAVLTWTGVAPKTGTLNDNLEIFFGSVTP